MAVVVALNVAEVAAAATVTEAGIVRVTLGLVRVTLAPPVGAALDKVTVQVLEALAPRDGAHGVVQCHISHAYPDGASLYYTYIFPRALDREVAQWRAIKAAASDAIAAHGGTISHHHGVGEDHLPWIAGERGALGIDVLRAVKMALDPKGVMNPGKLIP